jgi:protein phosphatase 1 regulatory subunit 37
MAEMEAALVRAPARPLADSDAALDARAADLAGALQKLIGRTSNAESLAELLALNDGVAERRAGRWTRPPRAGLGLNLGALAPVDEGMLTPGGSKGKGRAVPEPEVFEPVTTPTFVLASDDEAAHGLGAALDSDSEAESTGEGEEGVDQGVRSRTWVAEEGEVFRKGQALLGPEELEGDYDSEDLRQQVRACVPPRIQRAHPGQLLDAEIDRPPPRPIVDEGGFEIGVVDASAGAPRPGTPTTTTPTGDAPAPRPYVPRRRSSQASMTGVSSAGSAGTVKT